MVMPQIKNDLSMLKSLPTSLSEESSNIQEILNVYQTLEKHDLIGLSFIQEFRNKLTKENRKFVTENKIKDCKGFVAALYSFLSTNEELEITANVEKKSSPHHQNNANISVNK